MSKRSLSIPRHYSSAPSASAGGGEVAFFLAACARADRVLARVLGGLVSSA